MHSNFLYDSENYSIANLALFSTVPPWLLFHCSCFILLLISALLSSWSLNCDVEFDSNSSCLGRLNNVGMISSQKLQNLPQNAISRIVGTLMCKSGQLE